MLVVMISLPYDWKYFASVLESFNRIIDRFIIVVLVLISTVPTTTTSVEEVATVLVIATSSS
jgi:hypothetical protein